MFSGLKQRSGETLKLLEQHLGAPKTLSTNALTTQVSNTVLGDDDLHRVLAMVVVANHWRKSRDSTALSGRWSSINPSSDYFASIKNSPHQFNK